jgi:hypothetical protein
MKFVAIVDSGDNYNENIERHDFKTEKDLILFIENNNFQQIYFAGEYLSEYELVPKEVVTKYELQKKVDNPKYPLRN